MVGVVVGLKALVSGWNWSWLGKDGLMVGVVVD